MFLASRFGAALLVLSVAALAGCSMAPFSVAGSSAAVEAAKAQGKDALPRLRPKAIGVCYNSHINEPAAVESEAMYLCDGGRVVKTDEDFFWNGCSLTQPTRASYVCYPPDKAEHLKSERKSSDGSSSDNSTSGGN